MKKSEFSDLQLSTPNSTRRNARDELDPTRISCAPRQQERRLSGVHRSFTLGSGILAHQIGNSRGRRRSPGHQRVLRHRVLGLCLCLGADALRRRSASSKSEREELQLLPPCWSSPTQLHCAAAVHFLTSPSAAAAAAPPYISRGAPSLGLAPHLPSPPLASLPTSVRVSLGLSPRFVSDVNGHSATTGQLQRCGVGSGDAGPRGLPFRAPFLRSCPGPRPAEGSAETRHLIRVQRAARTLARSKVVAERERANCSSCSFGSQPGLLYAALLCSALPSLTMLSALSRLLGYAEKASSSANDFSVRALLLCPLPRCRPCLVLVLVFEFLIRSPLSDCVKLDGWPMSSRCCSRVGRFVVASSVCWNLASPRSLF